MASRNARIKTLVAWTLTALLAGLMAMSGYQKVIGALDDGLAALHVPLWAIPVIGTIELVGAALLLVPRTSFYGGVLLTGVLSGAVLTHWANADLVGWLFPFALGAPIATLSWLRRPPAVAQMARFARGGPHVDAHEAR